MKECMKDTTLTPVLAGSVLAFTLVMAAIGASDAATPFPETVATKPIGKDKEKPMIAVAKNEESSRYLQRVAQTR